MRTRIDAHHHLWQLGRFPYSWLAPDAPPRPFGDHSALKQDYLIVDYLRDMADKGVVASVFVEANAGAPDASEIEWLDTIARPDIPSMAVGHVDLRRPDLANVLDKFQASPRARGIRMSLCWSDRPEWQFIDSPNVLGDKDFQSGVRELSRRDMLFDILVVPGQLRQLAALAVRNPDQEFVINHLGTPLQEPKDRADWLGGIRDCAKCPNLSIKISGLWVIDRPWRPDRIRDSVLTAVDLFGPERCMWASNYPVEKLMCPVGDQIMNLEEVLDDLSEDAKDAIFCGTAEKLYRISLENRPRPEPKK